nr:lytic transglycosylase domain-containing protein [Aurantimonas sp. CSK15Z-1]
MTRHLRACAVRRILVAAAVGLALAAPAAGRAQASAERTGDAAPGETAPADAASKLNPSSPPAARPAPLDTGGICDLIQANARATGMTPAFFARLIWKESRFDIAALSPVGAQGIAQFMPYTARERGLSNPYDAVEAIRHSALYLKDLHDELGNWGLAAAAYNGGINRVKAWLDDEATLAAETEDYVLSIAAHPVDWFREAGHEVELKPLEAGTPFAEACRKLPVMKTRSVFASVDTAPMQPWGVQVAGHFSQSVAMKMFRHAQSAYPAVLSGRKPIVMRERNGMARRSIWAVRVGADTRGEANALCDRLRGAGGACAVYKN